MSGNWIKMGVGLRTHPKVVRMASALKADRLRVIGGLHAVWSIFDAHTDDGFLEGYDAKTIDEDLAWRGFAKAMQDVGWLDLDQDGARVPEYAEHNGATAKRRAMETRRKEGSREGTKAGRLSAWKEEKSRNESGQVSASDADSLRAREEKRREEPRTTPSQEERGERLGARPLALPAHWSPSTDDLEWAKRERPDLDGDPLIAMTIKFRKHHGEKKSRRFDWSETWREWVTREGRAQPPPGPETKADKRAKWASELTGKEHGQRTIDGTAERVG